MKKKSDILGLMGVMLVCMAGQRGGAISLQNPGFESNSGSGGSADWWSKEGRSGTENWANHSGSWGMAIYGWDPTPDYGMFYQNVSGGQADTSYTFSIWINKDSNYSADTVDLILRWYDSGSTLLGGVTNSVYSSLNTSWQQFSVSGNAPANTATVRAMVDSQGITDGGAVKFDDAALGESVPEPGAAPLLALGVLCLAMLKSGLTTWCKQNVS